MKHLLLPIFFFAVAAQAQQSPLTELPAGTYESRFKSSQSKWSFGDIVLANSGQYDLSASGTSGEYRFSAAAQRVFFTSGTLKGMFASTALVNNTPVIIFPANDSQPLKLPSELWCYWRK